MKPCLNCQRVLSSTQGPLCRTCYRKTAVRVKRCKTTGGGRERMDTAGFKARATDSRTLRTEETTFALSMTNTNRRAA